ncbi:MAG: L-rhamnose mutarotase [Chitinivibrionales bacterium]|nr:L-rhamnose mutarotase [Chitinivibrionales bacterium]
MNPCDDGRAGTAVIKEERSLGMSKRYAATCRLKPDKIEEYKKAHAAVWPEVESALKAAGLSNLSIYLLGDGLFMYYEYTGDRPHDEAMAEYLTKPRIPEWERLMEEYKVIDEGAGGNGFSSMQEIYHLQ